MIEAAHVNTSAKASLRALLRGVIDYAGLFPPASLPLDQSIRNYARYCNEPDRWMLGRFICPTTKFNELLPFVIELFDERKPLIISALGRAATTVAETIAAVGDDIEAVEAFRAEAGGRAVVDVLELKIPDPTIDVLERCEEAELRPFCEAAWKPGWDRRMGYKLRTGGVEAKAFPSPQHVASVIASCRDAGVPLKFTAGLHHPIRHSNDSVQTKMHGFINVFAAAAIAYANRAVDAQQLQAILEDEDAAGFHFGDDGLRWRSLEVTTAQIERARRDFAISFGSCSFDEPREDLRALGWM